MIFSDGLAVFLVLLMLLLTGVRERGKGLGVLGKVKFQESAKFRGRFQRDSALLAKEPIEHRLRHVGFLCDPVFGQAAGCNRLPQFVDDRLRIPLTVLWFHGRPSLVTIPFRVRCSAISRKVWPASRRLRMASIACCSSLFG